MDPTTNRPFYRANTNGKENPDVRNHATGLPNLPNLHGYCLCTQSQFTIVGADFELLLDNDPTRWIVDITNESARDIWVWNSPDNTNARGWKLPFASSKAWTFQDYLTLVTGQWYVRDAIGGSELGLTVCNIIRN